MSNPNPNMATRFGAGDQANRQNKAGRAKKEESWSGIVRSVGSEELPSGGTKREAIVRAVYKAAVHGESWAVRFLAEREEGKAKQSVEIETSMFPQVIIRSPVRKLIDANDSE